MGLINHFDSIHIPEVQPYKTYSYPELRKKLIAIFTTPDLTTVNIKELRVEQQKPAEAILAKMSRVEDNVAKAFHKLAEAIR